MLKHDALLKASREGFSAFATHTFLHSMSPVSPER